MLTVRTRVAFALNRACTTGASWWSGAENGRPVAASQTRAVWSALAVTTRAPSALHSMEEMALLCSIGDVNARPVAASQICATNWLVERVAAVRILLPSRLSSARVNGPPTDQT
jgi:hypothetical protein